MVTTPAPVARALPDELLALPDTARVVVRPTRPTPLPPLIRAPHLPTPPTEEERLLYYGPQRIWFITLRTLAAISATTSLLLFSIANVELWLFWVPLSIFAGYMVLTHYCTTRRRRHTREEHEGLVADWNPAIPPTVDVFLPCAGEGLDVLANTYQYVARMQYRGQVRVYVLDDSGRPAIQRLAESYGFRYLSRPDRGHMKKAGNLKFGFEHSQGDVIVIFDADFCPAPRFLEELLPYFEDPKIAIVQSPQFFDSGRTMSWLQSCAGTVQESFYRWAQPSRDRLGAPICVGTCALYRRSALNASGGFAQIGHSEDVHTGVNLMKVGYRTRYVPVVLAKGLCPDRLASFISQQYRWCAGSMSLLRDKTFHDSPLTYRQRMCFFTGFGYYISTAVGVFTLPLPTIVMLWFLPSHVQLSNFFWMIPTFVMYPIVRMVHRSGWTISTLRVYTISSFSHAAAIWHTLTGRTAEWVPSGAGKRTAMTTRVTRLIVGWTATTNLLMLTGCLHYVLTRGGAINVAPIAVVALMAMYTWLPIAWMAWSEGRERRRSARAVVTLPA